MPALDEAPVLFIIGEGVPRERLGWGLVIDTLQEDPGCAHHHHGCHHEEAETVHCAGHLVPVVLLLQGGPRHQGGEGGPQTAEPCPYVSTLEMEAHRLGFCVSVGVPSGLHQIGWVRTA